MSFKDIRGQDDAVSFLKSSIACGRIAHAYLFSGPPGVGKRLAALNFAKALNCLADGGAERPCDTCASCRKIDASNHPDVLLFKPDKEGASIKIEGIRGLTASIGLKPYEGRYKVYMIDDADAMGREAQNALLKTLEEPPPNSVIILITSDPAGLFPTVASRAQLVRFFPLKTAEIKAILEAAHNMDAAGADVVSRLSSGRLGQALKYGDGEFSQKRSRIIKGLVDKTLFSSDLDDIPKEDLRLYLDIMLTWYRDLLVAKAQDAGGAPRLFNTDRTETVMAESKKAEFEELYGAIRQIVLTNSFLDQNANPKLTMSALGANICTK